MGFKFSLPISPGKKERKERRKEKREEGRKGGHLEEQHNNLGTEALSKKIFVCLIPLARLSSSRLELDLIHLLWHFLETI